MKLLLPQRKLRVEEDGHESYVKLAADELSVSPSEIRSLRILNKSLIASQKSQFYYNITFIIELCGDYQNKKGFELFREEAPKKIECRGMKERPVIVGFGPAGIFAALTFIDHGVSPIIFERGKAIDERDKDEQSFKQNRVLNPESNVQFGEGGAGAYSDGKLVTMTKDSFYIGKVMETLIRFGAPEEISYVHKPHLGTEVVRKIVKKMRHYICDHGGDVFFSSKLTSLIVKNGNARGIVINNKDKYYSSHIILAIGHSARDTFRMLHQKNVAVEQKLFSIGTRIEHPAELIDEMQYGTKYKNFSEICPADYMLNYKNERSGREVFTFCMCPGGEVIAATSEEEMSVVNGMSYSKRNSPFSNSAIVVTVPPNDFFSKHPLSGIELQRDIEGRAFIAGNSTYMTPAQNFLDFLKDKKSLTLVKHSHKPGVVPCEIKNLFPGFIILEIMNALNNWQKKIPLFFSDKAILIGTETRTSSPVRLLRKKDGESVNMKNLYFIGEGSGYAGGIVSSAVDGLRIAEKLLEKGDGTGCFS